MNAPLMPEVLATPAPTTQKPLLLATEGVQRYVWESRFGAILVEVRDGETFVNGDWVRPAEHDVGDAAA